MDGDGLTEMDTARTGERGSQWTRRLFADPSRGGRRHGRRASTCFGKERGPRPPLSLATVSPTRLLPAFIPSHARPILFIIYSNTTSSLYITINARPSPARPPSPPLYLRLSPCAARRRPSEPPASCSPTACSRSRFRSLPPPRLLDPGPTPSSSRTSRRRSSC